ncbi:E3 Ubiquitin-Protein Ligase Trim9 [Manis pentadactyla]|nr:E3 Ubiquitin-Protein Ligase Trim9 [Manis pentadactyla]
MHTLPKQTSFAAAAHTSPVAAVHLLRRFPAAPLSSHSAPRAAADESAPAAARSPRVPPRPPLRTRPPRGPAAARPPQPPGAPGARRRLPPRRGAAASGPFMRP